MKLNQVILAFLDHRRGRRRSPRTIEQYQYHLEDLWSTWRQQKQLADKLEAITSDEFISYFKYLAEEHINKRTGKVGLSDETCAAAWRIIRALWNFAARRKWLTADQLDFFKDDELIPRPAVPERMRPVIEDEVLAALLRECDTLNDPEEQARTRAIILLLSESGLRISELISIQYEELDLKGRRCKVIGKGNRQGWAFWGYDGAVALRGYLRVRKGPKQGPLFLGTSPRNEGEPLTDDAIRAAMKRLAQQAGVELPPGAPLHSMRHRFGHKGIESGLDSSEVGQLMRHRHHTTTLRYLRENADRLSKIHERIDLDPNP